MKKGFSLAELLLALAVVTLSAYVFANSLTEHFREKKLHEWADKSEAKAKEIMAAELALEKFHAGFFVPAPTIIKVVTKPGSASNIDLQAVDTTDEVINYFVNNHEGQFSSLELDGETFGELAGLLQKQD